MVGGLVGGVISDPVNNVVSKDTVVVDKDVGSEGVVSGTVAVLVVDLASDITTDFEVRFNELRVGLELTPRFGTVLEMDLESPFGWSFETNVAPDFVPDSAPTFAPNLESDLAVVVVVADWSPECSGAELDMEEASVALKLEEADDEGLAAVGAARVAAGMGIAFTCIGVPRVRLHSMRQWRRVRFGLGR